MRVVQVLLVFTMCVIATCEGVQVGSGGRTKDLPVNQFEFMRIVGGSPTTIEKHPYQVAVFSHGAFMCGGSVLTEKHVLTAAHCTFGTKYSIRAGVTVKSDRRYEVQVTKVFRHPYYNASSMDFDVGVLMLSKRLPFNQVIQPVQLVPQNTFYPEGTICTITGWGSMGAGQTASRLQVVNVPIVSSQVCSSAYSLTERMFCAGFYTIGGKDSCQGDSGGPVIVNNMQYGIVSFGYGCAQAYYPGVYAHIPSFSAWIHGVIRVSSRRMFTRNTSSIESGKIRKK